MNKVGSYAVNPIDFNAWFSSDQTVKATKPKKQKTKKKIVYPQLAEYINYIDDNFWIKKLNTWSTGKLPKNFVINNNVIYYTKSRITIDFPFASNTGNKGAEACVDFFKTYGGIFSKSDELQQMEESENTETTTTEWTESTTTSQTDRIWSKCDKKTQELMVKNYVANLASVLKLTTKEHNQLLQVVRLAVTSKNFNKNNIGIELDKITEIRGLKFDSRERTFIVEMQNNMKVKKKDEDELSEEEKVEYQKDMVTQYRIKFEKYLEMYDKKYETYVR